MHSGLSLYFFMLILHVAINLPAQGLNDTLNRKDEKGMKQGAWQKRYESGMLQYEGRFVDDKPVGTFRYYYPEGTTKAITVFENKSDRSFTTLFTKGGKKMAEGSYSGQLKDSVWSYFNEKGMLINRENYEKGRKSGYSVTYFEDGLVADSSSYDNDTLHGQWKMYYSDQSIKSQGSYQRGMLQGEFRAWHSNGKLFITGTYKNSLREGIWSVYDKEERLMRTETYSDGKVIQKKILIPEDEDTEKAIKVDMIPE